jgi:hypothetical protein
MSLLSRPWSLAPFADRALGPTDCFLAGLDVGGASRLARAPNVPLLNGAGRELRLYPYPKTGAAPGPPEAIGLPARPRTGHEPQDAAEEEAAAALTRMHEVLARVGDLETALDDPDHLWERLAEAWRRAEHESDPRMAEIVRQARAMPAHLSALESRIRRVLRRWRERVPLNRVQEMDRSSMIWLARQPGRTIEERAGGDQRVLAIVRHENFDTLENRVLRAYVRLASLVARQWLREHRQAGAAPRYRTVAHLARRCRRIDRELAELGIGLAEPGVTPNYVLTEERDYRKVREAWLRLLQQELLEDDLWAWQAQSWTDFCVLALTLSLKTMEGAELVAQAPLVWMPEALAGQRFRNDRPLAVFWLRREGLIVEVQARPQSASRMQATCRAWVWLKITDLASDDIVRRVPVWTPHCFARMDLRTEATAAARLVAMAARVGQHEVMREGVILAPAHGGSETSESLAEGAWVVGIALDASGVPLRNGTEALRGFVRSCVAERL